MTTINAQTIVNEVMASALKAPSKDDATPLLEFKWLINKTRGLFDNARHTEEAHYLEEQELIQSRGEWLDLHGDAPAAYVTFKTSAKGSHKIKNTKESLALFAGKVRSNAAAFGGGLVRTVKARAAVVWPAKLIALFKQSMEDNDFSAALDIAERQLGGIFYDHGLKVAPVPCMEIEGTVSGMLETGTYEVFEPVSGLNIGTFCTWKKDCTRQSAINASLDRIKNVPAEAVARGLAAGQSKTINHELIRADWMQAHGLDDDRAIQSRIAEQARIDADREASRTARQAEHDAEKAREAVAQLVADAVAAVAVDAAMQPGAELATCGMVATCEASSSAGAGHSDSTGHASTWAPVPQDVPCSPSQTAYGTPTPPAFRGVDAQPTEANPLTDFDDSEEGISADLSDAAERATIEQVQALTTAEFKRLYDHLENWNFHTLNRLLQALLTGDAGLVASMRQIVDEQNKAGYLSGALHVRLATVSAAIEAKESACKADALTPERSAYEPSAQQVAGKPTINSKSGVWKAWLYLTNHGAFGLRFESSTAGNVTSTHLTAAARMAYLQSIAKSTDAAHATSHSSQAAAAETPTATDAAQAPTPSQNDASTTNDTTPREFSQADDTTPRETSDADSTSPTPETQAPQDAAPAFERFKPINIDPRALLAHGVTAAQLVGLGVEYTGNMANPSGSGAITAASDTRAEPGGSLAITVCLEDGRTMRADPHYFAATLRPILQFNGMMHGAPYLAQLAGAVATVKAQVSSAQEQTAKAYAQAKQDLSTDYAHLQRSESKYAGGKLAAINMRTLLKQAFPGQKFSVTSDYNSARVSWTDGPTDDEVSAIVARFDIGASDCQSDYFYTVSTAFSDLFGGVQYLTTRRETSDALVSRALADLYPTEATRPSVQDWRKCAGVFVWTNRDSDTRRMRDHINALNTYQAPATKTTRKA